MQERVSALRQKAAGIVLKASDALSGNVRRVGVAMVPYLPYGKTAGITDGHRRGGAEDRSIH